jgi:hypothetical protein
MAVTRTERKLRRLRTRQKLRKQMLVKNNISPTIKSPYKGESGQVLQD